MSRQPHDFSLWPERARPPRRWSVSRLTGAFSAVLACLVAGYAVVSELVRPTALQEPIGRSWETYAASSGQSALPRAAADREPATVAVQDRTSAIEARSASETARPRTRSAMPPMALAPIGTVGGMGATDGRRVPDGAPPDPPPGPERKAAPESPVARPAPVVSAPAVSAPAVSAPAVSAPAVTADPAGPPKEAIVAADDETPKVTEPVKPRKKARKVKRNKARSNDSAGRTVPWGQEWRRVEAQPHYGYGYRRPNGFFPY